MFDEFCAVKREEPTAPVEYGSCLVRSESVDSVKAIYEEKKRIALERKEDRMAHEPPTVFQQQQPNIRPVYLATSDRQGVLQQHLSTVQQAEIAERARCYEALCGAVPLAAQLDQQERLMMLSQQQQQQVQMPQYQAMLAQPGYDTSTRIDSPPPHHFTDPGNLVWRDYQMQLMLLEQQNRSRLMNSQGQSLVQEPSSGYAPVPLQANHGVCANTPNMYDEYHHYQMRLMLLEQQNKRRLRLGGQEQAAIEASVWPESLWTL